MSWRGLIFCLILIAGVARAEQEEGPDAPRPSPSAPATAPAWPPVKSAPAKAPGEPRTPPATTPPSATTPPPAPAVQAPAPAPSSEQVDVWLALYNTDVRVVLDDGRQLRGRLVGVEPSVVTLLLRNGDLANVRKQRVTRFGPPLALNEPQEPGHSEGLQLVINDLEGRARRKLVAGSALLICSGISFGFFALGAVLLAIDDSIAGLIMSSTGGTIGTLLLLIGLPLRASGSSEMEIVQKLRKVGFAVVPNPTTAPRGSALASGRGVGLSLSFAF